MSSAWTISETNERRSGLSKASRIPPAAASAYSPARGGRGMKARTARPTDWVISRLWVTSSSRRLSDRSATAPAQADSISIGPNWKPARIPTPSPLPVILSTSRVRATLVSQLPVLEISCPTKKSRKLRFRRARNVFLMPVPRRPGLRAGLADPFGDAGDALDQVVVAEGVGQAGVAGGAEGLTGHDRHLCLLQDQVDQLHAGGRPPPPQLPAPHPRHPR